MDHQIKGLHHITAIASNAQRNYDFYRKTLGFRFIKKTVNFDDPSVYHFYFGNALAEPGSVLTFFPWTNISSGRRGIGQATEIALSVPEDSFDFWINRFKTYNIIYNNPSKRFAEDYLTFLDPDGLKIELVINRNDIRIGADHENIAPEFRIKGFQSVTLTLGDITKTAEVLTDIFGYELVEKEVNRYRYICKNGSFANTIDLVHAKGEHFGHVAGGSVHHVAFRVENEEAHEYFRNKIDTAGLNVTEQIDRQYFKAIYFREPGGVLFEVSTDTPGFTVDESIDELGKNLKLPPQYEVRRESIEKLLPKILA